MRQLEVANQAAPAPQNSQSTAQDGIVELNWILFDKSDRLPCFIEIPRDLYEGRSQKCQPLFVEELRMRYDVVTTAERIAFWTPKEPLSVREAGSKGWAASVKDFEEQFSPVLLPEAFSENFASVDRKHIHLVITVRDEGLVEVPEFKRYNKTVLFAGVTPSEGAKLTAYRQIQSDDAQVIYDGRWAEDGNSTVAPPIQIFHPIFDDFTHLVNDPGFQPTVDDLRDVEELMYYAAEVGYGEYNTGRLRGILQTADTPFVIERKGELGEGGCDPSLQAGLSMKRYWIDPSRTAIREKCCCPTFLVAGGGPWFTVLGGVFTDKFIVQRLTDMKWNALSSTVEDSRVYHNARVLIALRECLVKLQAFYRGLQDIPPLVANKPHPRYFPYPTSFTAKDGTLTHIRYLASLEERAACVTYLAEIRNVGKVVVKFVARYGEEVHEFLALHGYAPALRYYGPLPETKLSGIPPGPAQSAPPGLLSLRSDLMHMVVMDYIDARPKPPPDVVRGQVRPILTLLHSEGYVFGDLREQNILFGADGKVKLIDLNWCGRYDMKIRDEGLSSDLQNEIDKNADRVQVRDGPYVHYPLSMSTVDGMWADGMEPLARIRPRHDWLMFGRLSW